MLWPASNALTTRTRSVSVRLNSFSSPQSVREDVLRKPKRLVTAAECAKDDAELNRILNNQTAHCAAPASAISSSIQKPSTKPYLVPLPRRQERKLCRPRLSRSRAHQSTPDSHKIKNGDHLSIGCISRDGARRYALASASQSAPQVSCNAPLSQIVTCRFHRRPQRTSISCNAPLSSLPKRRPLSRNLLQVHPMLESP
ncbi:hypothetical protein PYK22_00779 [Pyrinomonas methylaliphatogenes]|uniref:Uncharacterized protein n=1 Tax=Pyrinomonas methylaliphatogenes TaxID=454194 RepID=A0A0B6WWW2_9BACT|nr:hypothetical protein PYK22_00779 [Pyrinomonas methylaliphatogenes]